MKKTALALGVLSWGICISSFAQTSVNVEGIVDTYIGSMKNSGDKGRTTKLDSGGMSTSYFGFKGVEDLGDGLKATFTLGAFYRVDSGAAGRFNGDTFFGRDSNVGLSGNFGALTLGRSISPVTLPVFLFNPMGDSFAFSPLVLHSAVPTSAWGSSFGAGDTGWSNAIRYTTPSFGGATGNVYYQLGERTGDTSKKNVGGNVLYFNGPLSLTVAYHDVQVGNPNDNVVANGIVTAPIIGTKAFEQKLWFIGGAYNLGVAKVFLTYDQAKHDIDLRDKTASLGLSVPTGGAGKILGAVAQTRRSGFGFDERRRTTYSVGYDYNLSKRTDVYAYLLNDKVSTFDNAQSVAAGIRHRF